MSLRYGDAVVPRPAACLAGWFERRTYSFWSFRRWIELDGSVLSYRHGEGAEVLWTCDLRECGVIPGRRSKEIVLKRPNHEDISLFALNLEDLKVWFAEMKKVSDSVYDYYYFSAKVGRTDCGVVYLGRDKKTEEAVAITGEEKMKIPLEQMMILTKRDVTVVNATQTHDAIVKVIDIFESTKRFYTVTELVSGGTLEEALSREAIGESVARSIMRDLLRALDHLHIHNIVHGAVNASHIVCCRRKLPCAVKLDTFGKAVSQRDARLLGGAAENCTYAAPEVVCFQRRSGASDIFSAGVVLFRLLSGAEPFPVGHEAGYLGGVSKGARLDGAKWENVSSSAKKLVVGMLADEAGERPSAGDCLKCAWFGEGLVDCDGADTGRFEDGLDRMASDPKTVIVDYKTERA